MRPEPGRCVGCGANLAGTAEAGVERRQVFDLPPLAVQVTEHQLIAHRCEPPGELSGRVRSGRDELEIGRGARLHRCSSRSAVSDGRWAAAYSVGVPATSGARLGSPGCRCGPGVSSGRSEYAGARGGRP
ncbi:MAG: IS66 family transposase zinc-finger binding domain-containing protein [Pseudonocardiaceae bacterium]